MRFNCLIPKIHYNYNPHIILLVATGIYNLLYKNLQNFGNHLKYLNIDFLDMKGWEDIRKMTCCDASFNFFSRDKTGRGFLTQKCHFQNSPVLLKYQSTPFCCCCCFQIFVQFTFYMLFSDNFPF